MKEYPKEAISSWIPGRTDNDLLREFNEKSGARQGCFFSPFSNFVIEMIVEIFLSSREMLLGMLCFWAKTQIGCKFSATVRKLV